MPADPGWETAPLSSRLVRVDAGHSPDLPDGPAGAGEWGVLKVSAVHTDGYRPGENKAVGSASELIDPRYEVHPGDLLFSRANTPELVGAACLATDSVERLMLSDKTLRLVLDPDAADARFVNICLAVPSLRRQIGLASSGSSRSMQNISQRALGKLLLKWPSLKEQRRIVEILDAVSESERVAEVAIAKLRTLRSSFVEHGISAIDHWEPLGDRLDRIDAGHSPNLAGIPASPGEWGVLKVSAINEKGFRPSENKRISDPALIDERCEVFDGDLIIARASTANLVGRTCVVRRSPYRLLLSDKTLRFAVNPDKASRRYIDICFGSSRVRHQIEGMSSGISQGMQNITQGAISRILVPWVDVDSQRTFVTHVESIDDRIRAEVSSLERTRDLQEALVDSLLAGSRKETP